MSFGRVYSEQNPYGLDLTVPSSFKVPGTDVMVNVHGQPVGPTAQPGLLDRLVAWVKVNPLPAVGVAVIAGYLLRRR